MHVTGSWTFQAPRQRVWEALNDAEVLKRCTPGCERLERVGDDRYEATLKVGVAAIKGTFQGKLAIEDKRPPEHYRLVVQGAGAPGFVNAVADFDLDDQGDRTTLRYDWDVQAGGMIAGVGQRVLGGVAKFLIDGFYKQIEEELKRG